MDMQEIAQMPEFKPDVQAMVLAKCTEGERLMLEEFSVLRQENRWISYHVVKAYNLGVQNDRFISKIRDPVRIISAIVALIATVYITNWVTNLQAQNNRNSTQYDNFKAN